MLSYLLLQTLVPKLDTFGATFVVIGALVPGVDPLIAMCFYISPTLVCYLDTIIVYLLSPPILIPRDETIKHNPL